MKLDLLAFAAHPDDIELSCAGTLIKHIKQGHKAGIIDLTRGELGSRGSIEIRDNESKHASSVMGLSVRENLNMPDGFISEDKESLIKIIKSIRTFKPDIVLCNALTDRHPDHGIAGKLVARACYLSGLLKIKTGELNYWRPKLVLHYIQDYYIKPDIIIDISDEFNQKMDAIRAYKSQFFNAGEDNEPQTPISSEDFLEHISGRSKNFGREIGVSHGEGFTSNRILGTELLTNLI